MYESLVSEKSELEYCAYFVQLHRRNKLESDWFPRIFELRVYVDICIKRIDRPSACANFHSSRRTMWQ